MSRSSVIQGMFQLGRLGAHLAPAPGASVFQSPHTQFLHSRPIQPTAAPHQSVTMPKPHGVALGWAVQRFASGEAFQSPSRIPGLGSGQGRPLPAQVLQKMESFFGTRFDDVRVHEGNQASSIGALAFTLGSSLYFAPGQYNPTTAHGQRLLGHELTHVLQQRAGRVRNPFISGVAIVNDRGLEAEADRMGMLAATYRAPSKAPGKVEVKSPSAHLWTDVSRSGGSIQRMEQPKPKLKKTSSSNKCFYKSTANDYVTVITHSSSLQVFRGWDNLDDEVAHIEGIKVENDGNSVRTLYFGYIIVVKVAWRGRKLSSLMLYHLAQMALGRGCLQIGVVKPDATIAGYWQKLGFDYAKAKNDYFQYLRVAYATSNPTLADSVPVEAFGKTSDVYNINSKIAFPYWDEFWDVDL